MALQSLIWMKVGMRCGCSASTCCETWGDMIDTEVNVVISAAVMSAITSCIRCTISELVKELTLPSRVCYISRHVQQAFHDGFNSTVYARQHTIPGDFFGSSCCCKIG